MASFGSSGRFGGSVPPPKGLGAGRSLTKPEIKQVRNKLKAAAYGMGGVDWTKLFNHYDRNNTGELNLMQFKRALRSDAKITVSMLPDNHVRHLFNTIDLDGGGTIDEEEFEALAKTISHKDPTFPGNFARALEEFDTDGDGLIDFEEFVTMNRRYPMVLFPMFRLQDKMQKQTLGLKRWNQVMKMQMKLEKVRQHRFTHGGEMPPEGCWSKLTRCGAVRLGAEEDFADLEREMNLLKRSDGKKKKKKGGGGSTGQAKSSSKMAW